jgi:hypothetical protein
LRDGALAPTWLAAGPANRRVGPARAGCGGGGGVVRDRSPTTAASAAEAEFASRGLTVVDRLLSADALRELRAFCVDSTFYHKNYIQVASSDLCFVNAHRALHLTQLS